MRVLLINSNREKMPQIVFPLGLCCVAAAVRAAGRQVRTLDLCFSRRPKDAVSTAIADFVPEVIGISVRNLDNCDFHSPRSHLPFLKEIVDSCKDWSTAPIMLGGAAVNLAAESLLSYTGADYAVIGEGEVSAVALLSALDGQGDPRNVPGVLAAGRGTNDYIRRELIDPLSAYASPLLADDLDIPAYRAFGAALPVQTKRGCAFQCNYCVYPRLEGACWRLRDPEVVAEEVAGARRFGLSMVEFVDSVFGLPEAHAIACCEAIARRGFGIPLCVMELNPLACSPQLIGAMNAANFTAAAISAESGSAAMLESMQKGYSVNDLHRAADEARKLQAQKLWIFMLGAPGECETTVHETARFIAALPKTDLVYINYGVRVLPGAALHEQLIADGVVDAGEDLLWPRFYFSPRITPARCREVIEGCGFPRVNMVTLHDGEHQLIPAVQRVAVLLGLRPPFWRYIPWLNRLQWVLTPRRRVDAHD
ncbi:MAG: B12-binding domain-containing radical SAM protein [Armatimonadota bacterium]